MMVQRCLVVDPEPNRRALVCKQLWEVAVDVEQFKWIKEVEPESLENATLFVSDQGEAVASIVQLVVENLVSIPIIAYSEDPEIDRVVQTIKVGADSYLAWPFAIEQILTVFKKIECQVARSLGNKRLEAMAKQLIKQLTKREREILSGVIHGWSNQQIGAALGISARTVEIHRANVIKKLGARNSASAVKIALDAGFNDTPRLQSSSEDCSAGAA
ncbi:hypothetical protein G6N82_01165 [Altererythrobacter sp. BO-6]|uniref:LuxR C-terminal-related transcriptional regulator n=1 Tax=Altererythrobacter sp. BO-6 TaxID=2604537 RepID=UPI0013E1EBA5|nr:LuxR C-terminal-related transcriptional regulator [Altererythrobacter sp. BO-6]QIG52956.1 hypothetical protein G6N82_01165 [Altererythrobacter sp. BO-6]